MTLSGFSTHFIDVYKECLWTIAHICILSTFLYFKNMLQNALQFHMKSGFYAYAKKHFINLSASAIWLVVVILFLWLCCRDSLFSVLMACKIIKKEECGFRFQKCRWGERERKCFESENEGRKGRVCLCVCMFGNSQTNTLRLWYQFLWLNCIP